MPASATHKANVCVLRLSLKDATHDNDRLNAACRLTQERLYIAIEGDWSEQTRDVVQSRLMRVLDNLCMHFPMLDHRLLLPAEGSHIFKFIPELGAILSSPGEREAIASICKERQDIGLHELDLVELDAPCPESLETRCWDEATCKKLPPGSFNDVVLGGTFDRLHGGHKLLLAMSCLAARKRLLIGVSEGALLDDKTLGDLMTSFSQRQERLTHYLQSTRPCLKYEIVPIQDPFGPSIVDKDLNCIVVSLETSKGGESVNRRRVANGLDELAIHIVGLVGTLKASDDSGVGESKLSSTGSRKDVLGKFCGEGTPRGNRAGGFDGSRDFVRMTNSSESPYVIGLTGGIASGKSTVCAVMKELGAIVIDCDKLGHQAYEKGGSTFAKIVAEFGDDVVDGATGEINRRVLGAKVFGDEGQMKRLTDIVWPCIRSLAKAEIAGLGKKGVEVCVMEAAVLLEAGWNDMVDEIWVVRIPPKVAVERLVKRSGISAEDAQKRIDSQWSNDKRTPVAHVVISNEWDQETTRIQVSSSWLHLKERTQLSLPAPLGEGKGGLLENKWTEMCVHFGIEQSTALNWYRKLWRCYGGYGRFYHTRDHLRHMFSVLDEHTKTIKLERPMNVYLAIFFHDLVYDPPSSTNEADSVTVFRQFCKEVGPAISAADVEMVSEWIMMTASHHSVNNVEGDLAIFLDCDLAVLALPFPQYSMYSEGIRREYCYHDATTFATRRKEALHNLISAERLFHTVNVCASLEKQARLNIEREMKSLDFFLSSISS